MNKHKQITCSILICALNEEKSIGRVLKKIKEQVIPEWLTLEKIVVVSDASTDKTQAIVQKIQVTDPKIELVVNEVRLGKALSFNLGKRTITSDFLVSLDADIEIVDAYLFENLFKLKNIENIGLIGGEARPKRINNNIANRASTISYLSVSLIKERILSGDNLYSAHGRILALSKKLYAPIVLPDTGGTDQYMYLTCIKIGLQFKYNKQAIVFYIPPTTVKDYLKQYIRFRKSNTKMGKFFDKDFVEKETEVPFLIKVEVFVRLFFSNTLDLFSWVILTFIGIFQKIFTDNSAEGKWDISKSTKI